MNAHKFVAVHGIEKAKEVLEGAPPSATHFNQNSLGGHYAKEVLFKMDFRWAWYNKICQAWYYDFAEHNHFELSELKQVVESVEIVQRSGGFESVKAAITNYRASGDMVTFSSLEKRLADYEIVESYKENQHV
ncbi:hypothetical protein [Acinetobacter guerrae]|uniref:hypothetical protein n=1 Tax=Acinetobacter guerrae TaxID=1843371 RepID=UPI00128BEE6E|nr:hypothetical protein [Acinetobacter guerrae]MPW43352.1 hypothetical protein [Acinetobacter guerrae]